MSKAYILDKRGDIFITNDDNYNYKQLIKQDGVLVIKPEDGILSNDMILSTNYKIKLYELSENSNINDIEINETTGGFSYLPSSNLVNDVIFKYYIEYDDKISNVSYISFYIN